MTNDNILIRELSNEELLALYKKVKPIVTLNEIKFSLRKYTLEELRKYSYIWHSKEDSREIISSKRIETIDEFDCFHRFGYYGLFKPTIAEVLSQIPNSQADKINAFEILSLYDINDSVNKGYHKSKVRTYKIRK